VYIYVNNSNTDPFLVSRLLVTNGWMQRRGDNLPGFLSFKTRLARHRTQPQSGSRTWGRRSGGAGRRRRGRSTSCARRPRTGKRNCLGNCPSWPRSTRNWRAIWWVHFCFVLWSLNNRNIMKQWRLQTLHMKCQISEILWQNTTNMIVDPKCIQTTNRASFLLLTSCECWYLITNFLWD
jgi:hypothetical protein